MTQYQSVLTANIPDEDEEKQRNSNLELTPGVSCVTTTPKAGQYKFLHTLNYQDNNPEQVFLLNLDSKIEIPEEEDVEIDDDYEPTKNPLDSQIQTVQ